MDIFLPAPENVPLDVVPGHDLFLHPARAELQKGGILVSRIPDISGRKSGHFHIVAANLSIFGIKRLQLC